MSATHSRGRLRWARRLPVVALAGVLAALGATAGAAPVGAIGPASAKQPTVTFGIGPAGAKAIDGRSVLNYTLAPGSFVADHIGLVNLATKPVTLSVYAADALNNKDGSIGYQPRADAGSDARRWISVRTPGGRGTITLPPRKTEIVPIDIRVPQNASPGDHIAGIVASLTSKVTNPSGERVNFEQRVALRTFFRVSGALRPALSIENLHATYHGTLNPFGSGRATITYTVHNTGNINLGGRQKVTVTGLFGSTGSLSRLADVPVLLPGSRLPVRVEVRGVWPEIFMHAKVTVSPEAVAGTANPTLRRASASTGFRAVPWTLLGLVVVLIGAGVGLWQWRRRTRRYSARHPKSGGREPVLSGKA